VAHDDWRVTLANWVQS